MDPLRDRVFGLMSDICGLRHDVRADSLRLLSHTLLGVARDDTPQALEAIREALPWLTAFLEAEAGANHEIVARMLVHADALQVVPKAVVLEMLAATDDPGESIGGLDSGSRSARIARAFRALATLDADLATLSIPATREIRRHLFDDARLLAVAMRLDPQRNHECARLCAALGKVGDPAAMKVLADLESSWDASDVRRRGALSERSLRFAMSAADHLSYHGFLPAVRLALTYDRPRDVVAMASEVLPGDAPLSRLAWELSKARGHTLTYARGGGSLDPLARWVHYLASGTEELAKTHRCDEREARSFAHFALHLVNFCDMMADDDASEALRNACLDVENELRDSADDRAVELSAQARELAWANSLATH